jgi:hypothetical protein
MGEVVLRAVLPSLLAQPEPSRTESFKSILQHGHASVAEPALTELLKHAAALGACGPQVSRLHNLLDVISPTTKST